MQPNTTLTVPAPGVLANDGDSDDDTLTVMDNTQPVDLLGDVTVNPDGSLTYTSPALGIALTRTFTYTVSDGVGGTDTATVTIDIQPAPAGSGAHPDATRHAQRSSMARSTRSGDTRYAVPIDWANSPTRSSSIIQGISSTSGALRRAGGRCASWSR